MRRFLLVLWLVTSADAELTATFTREGASDSRLDRFPALSVPPGEAPTPFLTPGFFEAAWTGKLSIPRRQRLVFSFEGEGRAELSVAGRSVLALEGDLGIAKSAVIRLDPGEHEFRLAYSSKPDGSATFRLYWEESGFTRQTVPYSAFHTERGEAAVLGELRRLGRQAFARQNCVKCHAASSGLGSEPMPETQETAPLLAGIGERVSEDWLRRWIAAPQALKPATAMPALIDPKTDEGLQQAADLAAYLSGLKLGAAAAPDPDPALAPQGGARFHELGCIGCHTLPDSPGPDPSRTPLNDTASKFRPGALTAYLQKPDLYHPFTAMPDFRLSGDEAASIAAYLIAASQGRQTQPVPGFPAGDGGRGSKLAESLRCGACHPGLPVAAAGGGPSLEAIFTQDWAAHGCAAPAEKRGRAPYLNLTDGDRAALAAFAKTGGDSLRRDAAAEYARRQTQALRCTACHAMDDQPARLDGLQGETRPLAAFLPRLDERLDQTRPRLTYTGEMLLTPYIESMLKGAAEPRPRPWLGMRMPAYRAHAVPLAAAFSRWHGIDPGPAPAFAPDAALAGIGKRLVGADGFGCSTCHAVGEAKPTAAFEVEGIAFRLVPQRLRAGYYYRWMDNPQAVMPGTKMPRYAHGDRSPRVDVLEGDAGKQYEAIWHYLHAGEP